MNPYQNDNFTVLHHLVQHARALGFDGSVTESNGSVELQVLSVRTILDVSRAAEFFRAFIQTARS